MPLEVGTRLGPYEIQAALGAGGMGEVYRARDTRLDRTVAVKVLNDALGADSQFRERFGREARAISQLNHPHICTLHDIGHDAGVDFLVMEYLEGETLSDRLGRSKESALPLAEALTIAIHVCDALAAAHRAGIVHRDLKPGNVMLTKSGAKLLDFGLAKHGPGSAGGAGPVGGAATPGAPAAGLQTGPNLTAAPTLTSPLTIAGSIVGTLLYMSPEQLHGTEADTRSDIFALGAVLYEMLTGKKAFSGKSQVSVMAAILDQDPPSLTLLQPALPPELDRIVRKCLEKDPEARWQSARDLQSELEWIAQSSSQAAARGPGSASTGTTPGSTPRRRPWPWIAAAILLPLIAAAATWTAMHFAPVPRLQPMRFAIPFSTALPLAPSSTDRQVAISADGRNIVYVAGGTTLGQLMVRAIDRLDSEPLRGIANARFPFLSPDGKWVGFFSGTQELRKVSITGGPAITVCRLLGGPRGASWGPDDTIVFATTDTAAGLMSVPAGGGEPKVLTKPNSAGGELNHLYPFVLPGGQAVLFTITSPGPIENAQIAVLDLKTGRHKTLIRGGSQGEYVETGHIVYAAAGSLRAVRFDPVKLDLLGDPVPVVDQVTMKSSGAAEFAISRTGALLFIPGAFSSAPGSGAARSLLWVNRQGREEPIKAPPRAYFALRLSPDNTRVALDIRDQENDIWTWDLAREILTRLTFDPTNDIFPIWTPDGRRVVFSSPRGGSTQNVFWQPADGTGMPERLAKSDIPYFANSFSPDGTQLVMQAGGTGTTVGETTFFDIFVLPMDGKGKAAPLIQSKFAKRNADISPDGRWMAYESNESGQFQIYVQPFPNVNAGRWQISTAGGTKPIWARSGKELFFVDGNSFLTTVSVQTGASFSAGNPTKLLEAKYFYGVQQSRSYDVSRDGQRFLMIKDQPVDPQKAPAASSSMVVVLNWQEELKQRLPVK